MSGAKDRGKKPPRITAVRLAMLEGGYLPIPVNGKRPLISGWQRIIADPEIIRGWVRDRPNDRGTGSLTKIMPTIDADILDERSAEIIGLQGSQDRTPSRISNIKLRYWATVNKSSSTVSIPIRESPMSGAAASLGPFRLARCRY